MRSIHGRDLSMPLCIALVTAFLPAGLAGCSAVEGASPGDGTIGASADVRELELGVARYDVLAVDGPIRVALLDDSGAELGQVEFTDPTTSDERHLSLTWAGTTYRWDAAPEGDEEQALARLASLAARDVCESLGIAEGLASNDGIEVDDDDAADGDVSYAYSYRVYGYGYAYSTGGYFQACQAAYNAALWGYPNGAGFTCFRIGGWELSNVTIDSVLPAYNDCSVLLHADCGFR